MSGPPPPPGPPPGPPPSGPPPGWTPPPGPGGWPAYPPPPPSRRRWLPLGLAVLAAVLVVAAVVVVPVVLLSGDSDDASDGATADSSGEAAGVTDLAEVEEYDDLPTTHVEGDVDYEQTPPVGGEHASTWLDCGVYDEPVRDENAVHDLEHGTVWITYEPGLAQEDVDHLAGLLPQNGILSPYEGMDAPVVVTVWGRQLALTGARDPGLEAFIEEFEGGVTAPEPFASCAGGIPQPEGTEA